MDGGSVAIGREPMRPTAMEGSRDCSRQSPVLPPSMAVRSVAIGREPMRSTAREGGRDCSRQSSAFPPSMEVRSAEDSGSGPSENLEGLLGIFVPFVDNAFYHRHA
ncbi:hypothetical protein [Candidatus Methylobacter oryzae]|nr:hypothetical protein [Candidatus Methylobacter oryzae]